MANHCLLKADVQVFGREHSALDRPEVERLEEARRHSRGWDTLGRRIAADVHCTKDMCPDRNEHGARFNLWKQVATPVDEQRGILDRHQALGLRIREWTQQDRVCDTEERGVGSDTQCEREDDDARKRGRTAQRTNGLAKVVCHKPSKGDGDVTDVSEPS